MGDVPVLAQVTFEVEPSITTSNFAKGIEEALKGISSDKTRVSLSVNSQEILAQLQPITDAIDKLKKTNIQIGLSSNATQALGVMAQRLDDIYLRLGKIQAASALTSQGVHDIFENLPESTDITTAAMKRLNRVVESLGATYTNMQDAASTSAELAPLIQQADALQKALKDVNTSKINSDLHKTGATAKSVAQTLQSIAEGASKPLDKLSVTGLQTYVSKYKKLLTELNIEFEKVDPAERAEQAAQKTSQALSGIPPVLNDILASVKAIVELLSNGINVSGQLGKVTQQVEQTASAAKEAKTAVEGVSQAVDKVTTKKSSGKKSGAAKAVKDVAEEAEAAQEQIDALSAKFNTMVASTSAGNLGPEQNTGLRALFIADQQTRDEYEAMIKDWEENYATLIASINSYDKLMNPEVEEGEEPEPVDPQEQLTAMQAVITAYNDTQRALTALNKVANTYVSDTKNEAKVITQAMNDAEKAAKEAQKVADAAKKVTEDAESNARAINTTSFDKTNTITAYLESDARGAAAMGEAYRAAYDAAQSALEQYNEISKKSTATEEEKLQAAENLNKTYDKLVKGYNALSNAANRYKQATSTQNSQAGQRAIQKASGAGTILDSGMYDINTTQQNYFNNSDTEAAKKMLQAYTAALDNARAAKVAFDQAQQSGDVAKQVDSANKLNGAMNTLDALYKRLTVDANTFARNEKLRERIATNVESIKSMYEPSMDAINNNETLKKSFEDLCKPEIWSSFTQWREALAAFNKQAEASGIKITDVFDKIKMSFTDASIIATVKGMLIRKAVQFITSSIRTLYQEASTLNAKLAEFQVVSGKAANAMTEMADKFFDAANEVSSSVEDIIEASTTFSRLGFSDDEALVFAKLTTMYAAVGDVSVEDAESHITSIIKAYGVGVDSLQEYLDKLVLVGNNYAISASELGEGLANAGSLLAVNGNTLEESIALLLGANNSMQDISKASTALRTISARLTQATTELEEMGESTDDLAVSTYTYRQEVLEATDNMLDITDANGNIKSTIQILRELAGVWDELTDKQQDSVKTLLAGKNQQTAFASLMQSWDEVEAALVTMESANGNLDTSYAILEETTDSYKQRLSNVVTELGAALFKTDGVNGALQLLTSLLERLSPYVDIIGSILQVVGKILGMVSPILELIRVPLGNLLSDVSFLLDKLMDFLPTGLQIGDWLDGILEKLSWADEYQPGSTWLSNLISLIKSFKSDDDDSNTPGVQTDAIVSDNSASTVSSASSTATAMSNDLSDAVDTYQSTITTLYEAWEKLTSGEMEKSDLIDLIQEFPTLAENVDTATGSVNELGTAIIDLMSGDKTDMIDELNSALDDPTLTDEARAEIEALIQLIEDGFADLDFSVAEEFKSVWEECADVLGDISDPLEDLAKLQDAITNSTKMTLSELMEYADIYPEILEAARVTADGQIQLDSDVATSFIEAQKSELQAQIDTKVQELELQKSELEAEISLAQSKLELAKNVSSGKIDMSATEFVNYLDMVESQIETEKNAGTSTMEIYNATANQIQSDMSTALSNTSKNCVTAANIWKSGAQNIADNSNAAAAATAEDYADAASSGITSAASLSSGWASASNNIITNANKAAKSIANAMKGLTSSSSTSGVSYTNYLSLLYTGGSENAGIQSSEADVTTKVTATAAIILNRQLKALQDTYDDVGNAIGNLKSIDVDSLISGMTSSISSMSGSGSSSTEKSAFEKLYEQYEHEVAIGEKTTAEFLKWLDSAYKAAYAEGTIDLDDYWKYQEEVYDGYQDLLEDAKDAFSDLVDEKQKLIEQDLENQKESLEDQLDALEEFYDKQIDMLEDEHDEEEYIKNQTEKRQAVADLQAEMEQLSKDNSAWAEKRRLELQEELDEATEELNEFESDQAREDMKEFLETEYENQEKAIESQIQTIEDKLDDPQSLFNQALTAIQTSTTGLYDELLAYNRQYGSGNDEDIQEQWEEWRKALLAYATYTGSNYKGVSLKAYASGTNFASGGLHVVNEDGQELILSQPKSGNFAWLNSGDKVFNSSAAQFLYDFANAPIKAMANYLSSGSSKRTVETGNGGTNIVMGDINISGSADKQTVSEIRRAQRESLRETLEGLKKLQK